MRDKGGLVVWLLGALLCCWAATAGAEPLPTIYYFEARGQALIAVQTAGQGRPVFLVFPEHCHFSPEYALQLGEALFPGENSLRADRIRQFQEALRAEYSSAVQVSGGFDLNTIEQIHRSAEKLPGEVDIGSVHVVQLNKLLQSQTGISALRAFLGITTRVTAGGPLSDEQINRCRPDMERNLNHYVERSEPRIIEGALRGVFGLAVCSGASADTDGDRLYDVDEINLYGSDPNKVDSDGDGLTDREEVEAQNRGLILDPTKMDSDGDGLNDKQEMDLRARGVLLDPGRADTDGDGLTDKQEVEAKYRGQAFDPTNPHSFSGTMGDRSIYESQVLGGTKRGIVWLALILLVAAAGGTVAFVMTRRGRNNGVRVARRQRRTTYVRRTVLQAPPAMVKTEPIAEAPGMRMAVMDPVDRRLEMPLEPPLAKPHAVPVEPVRPVAAVADDSATIVREKMERLSRTINDLQLRTEGEQAERRRQMDSVLGRVESMADSLAGFEQRESRRVDMVEREAVQQRQQIAQLAEAVRRLESQPQPTPQPQAPADHELRQQVAQLAEAVRRLATRSKADPTRTSAGTSSVETRLEQLAKAVAELRQGAGGERDAANSAAEARDRRLDQIEAAVRTLEHVSFAESPRDQQLHDRLNALERAANQPVPEPVDLGPVWAQTRELAASLDEWKTSMTATLQTMTAEQKELQKRVTGIAETIADRGPTPAVESTAQLQALERRLETVNRLLENNESQGALANLRERVEAMGRVITQVSQQVDQMTSPRPPVELLRRLEAVETQLAGLSGIPAANGVPNEVVLQKIKDVEQMVVRSMSEWGRLFTDLEDKIVRMERAAKLKK